MRRRRRTVVALLALAVAASTSAVASGRSGSTPVTVTCGQTLTASVTLANGLVNCPGDGLIVGSAGITVDLNGHTIDGTNALKSAGIANDGHANVRILNGTVTGFRLYGIAIRRARGNTLTRLAVRQIGAGSKEPEAAAGILIDHSPGATVSRSVVTNRVHAFQSDGIDVLASPGAVVDHTTLSGNAWNGLVVLQSPRTRVIANDLDGNANNGMEANAGSDSVVVSGNRARGNEHWGLVVGALGQARVVGNTVSSNGRDGFLFFDLQRSTVQGNRASGNANGIELARGQHGSKSNQLLGNTVRNNKQSGIVVESAGNRLRGNTAVGNREHGIDASDGTIDGGGNRARGNRLAPQCVGVACS